MKKIKIMYTINQHGIQVFDVPSCAKHLWDSILPLGVDNQHKKVTYLQNAQQLKVFYFTNHNPNNN